MLTSKKGGVQKMEILQPEFQSVESKTKTAYAYVRVFLYMAIGLAITTIVALGLPYLMFYIAYATNNPNDVAVSWYVLVGISSILQIILIFIVNSKTLQNKKIGTWVSYTLYSICMGILMSIFFAVGFEIALPTFGVAFGITCIAFLIMALIGYLTKGNLNIFANIALGLLFSGLILSFVNWMLMIFMPVEYGVWTWIDWVITFVMLIGILLITAFDMNNFKNTIQAGVELTHGLLVFYAFQFYVDFIYILIRIMTVLIATRR